MFKKFLFLFLSVLILHPQYAFAGFSFTRYSTNPIISPSISGWDSTNIFYPSVLYESGLYKMWYTANNNTSDNSWKIGYAVSLDGINWLKYPNNPIIPSSNDPSSSIGYKQPTVIKDGNVYKMWFESVKTPEGKDQIGYATSSSGIDWKIYNYKVYSPINSWENGGLAHPAVLKIGNKYYMWYAGTSISGDPWRVGLVTSENGINWTPASNSPVLEKSSEIINEYENNSGIMVTYDDSLFHMYYGTNHYPPSSSYVNSNIFYATSSSGLVWEPKNRIPILTRDTNSLFDSYMIMGGSATKVGNTTFLWYGGKQKISGIQKNTIGLAYDGENPIPIPTPSEFPLPSPTPEIIPTPTPKDPIVIVPGIMASWNREVLLENKEHSATDWNIIPFVKEYDGLIKTLENLGYVKNINLFIWPYDWRKSIDTIALQFDSFINQKVKPLNKDSKIHFIGHSLGGLVSRTWAQKNTNADSVKKLLTVGSPQSGVVQPYKLWEGGEIDKDYGFLSFAGRLLLILSSQSYTTNRTVIQQKFPVLKDILPTEPYLINEKTSQLIPQSQMRVWNNWLTLLNTNSTSILPHLITLRGSGLITPYTYTVAKPSYLDAFLGNWIDGKPIATNTSDGDGTVAFNRGSITSLDPVTMSLSHNELVASKAGIDQILTQLSINHTEDSIMEGVVTTIRPGLFLYLRSPATLQLAYNGEIIPDQEGIIFIPGIMDGTYSLQVKGTGNGIYRLGIIQMAESGDYWKEYTGIIENGKTIEYTVQFDYKNPNNDPLGQRSVSERFSEFELLVKNLATISEPGVYKKLTMDIATAKRALDKKQWLLFKDAVELILTDFSTLRTMRPTSATVRSLTLGAGDSLIDLFQAVYQNSKTSISKSMVESLGTGVNEMEKNLERLMETLASYKRLSHPSALLFLEGQNYRKNADAAPTTQLPRKYMLYTQAQLLFGEIR